MFSHQTVTWSVIQGITEMLPVASGYHLELVGANNSELLHLVTALITLIYAIIFEKKAFHLLIRSIKQLAFRFVHYTTFLPFVLIGANICILFFTLCSHSWGSLLTGLNTNQILATLKLVFFAQLKVLPISVLLIAGINKSVTKNSLRTSLLLLVGFIIQSFMRGLKQVLPFLRSSKICGASILGINGLVLFYLESMDSKGTREIGDFGLPDLVWSIIANLIGLVPGASRSGSVYTVLRVRGFKAKPALLMTSIQGIFTVVLSLRSNLLLNYNLTSTIICGTLHLFMIYTVLHLNAKRTRQLIMICGIYRILLGSYLVRNYATDGLYNSVSKDRQVQI